MGDVCRVQSGGTPPRGNTAYYGGSIPWAKIEDLTRSGMWIKETEESITQLAIESSSARIFPPGTVLLAMYGSIGTASIAAVPLATNQAILGCRCSDELMPEFLWFWLFLIRPDLLAQGRGGTQRNLNAAMVKDLLVPLPPLAEQQRIAAILKEQMATVERARAAAEARMEAANALPAAYLRTIFDGPDAHKWPRKRLGELLHLRKEVVHPRDDPIGPVIFVGLEHVEPNTGRRIGSVQVEMASLTGRKPRFLKGDIVYGYLRPYLNKVWVADFDGLCSVDQYVYSVDQTKASADFVAWFMRSPVYLTRAPIGYAPGQLPRIRTEEVASVEINLPSSIEDQSEIATVVAARMNGIERGRQAIEDQLAAIHTLPLALVSLVLGGGRSPRLNVI